MMLLDILIVLLLILLNGALSLSELAIISARRPRLRVMAAAGNRGAAMALALAEHPGRFLSTVQIGITLVAVLMGAFSGVTIAEALARQLEALGMNGNLADTLAFTAVVGVTTYFSLILGELVPKQIALADAEHVAARAARPMAALARLGAPLVWFLDRSSRFSLRLLGYHARPARRVSEEEVRAYIAEATAAGAVEPAERSMIERVMRLGGRPIRAVMTHRLDVEWIDLDASEAERRA
ncbi:MAG: hemolysin family protein, partial [Pseudomonadota bacterium]